jgi:hypothetical protein
MTNLRRRPNDAYAPENSFALLDVVADLRWAVLHSFSAIEAIANDSIDRLLETATATIGEKDRVREVPKAEMVRVPNLDEKLSLVVPMRDDGAAMKATRPWGRYLARTRRKLRLARRDRDK